MALTTLSFTYDELLIGAVALEQFIAQSTGALTLPLSDAAKVHLQQQIDQAEALLSRLNEARR